jgi:hypothetical protein
LGLPSLRQRAIAHGLHGISRVAGRILCSGDGCSHQAKQRDCDHGEARRVRDESGHYDTGLPVG